jgi:type IX secretion system substrate protein
MKACLLIVLISCCGSLEAQVDTSAIGSLTIGIDSVARNADTLGQSDHAVCASSTDCLRSLPVTLLQFTGRRTSPAWVALQWSTASEQNNKGFWLERSFDRQGQFIPIAFIPGKVNSNLVTAYGYDDANAVEGTTWYRLRQLDMDERATLSKTIAIAGTSAPVQLLLYPNPADNYAVLSVNNNTLQVRSLILYNSNGVEVWRKEGIINNADNIRIPLQQLAAGIYSLRVKCGDTDWQTLKLIKR